MMLVDHGLDVERVASRAGAKSVENRYVAIKPCLEFPLALVLLLLSAPIILLALVLVKLSSRGPSIYTQRRLGLGGKAFVIYKIRTMYHDSERDCGPTWCVPGDPRVTPVGWILRWTHLDELPQLINVLRGEMSLIGPRPERPEIVAELERKLPDYRRRLLVRPGLTGLAQVQQPPDTDLGCVRRKLRLDLFYIERMSLGLDLRILLATLLYVGSVPGEAIARIFQFPGGGRWTGDETADPAGDRFVGSPIPPPRLDPRGTPAMAKLIDAGLP